MAAPVKRIVCLANSRKYQERCIAGRELLQGGLPGPWVRPVSAREHEGVSVVERHLADRGEPLLLDVIDVPVVEARPKSYQSENWLLDSSRPWELVGRYGPARLARLVEPESPLWVDGYNSGEGINDRMPTAVADGLDSSLRLIKVQGVSLRVTNYKGKSVLRVVFRHAGSDYGLRLTDPEYEIRYEGQPAGVYSLGESYLTISLGEPYEGNAYKLIPALMQVAEVRSAR